MNDLIDSVADITDLRDKDALEITLATVMFELIEASELFLWRLVTHDGVIKLRQRVKLPAADDDDDLDSIFIDARDLPTLDSCPELQNCYDSRLHLCRPPVDDRGMYCHIFPVTNGRRVICLLEITRPSPLPMDQERLVFGLLRIYRNHLGIIDYSDCDELTGLLNRRTFDEAFRRMRVPEAPKHTADNILLFERRGVAENEARAYLAVADIDFFKRVNDQFGHPYGDEVLVLLTRLMGSSFRDTDQLFRFGGEEFVVILPNTSPQGAELALERFRAAVEAFDFPQVGSVTVSIGYTAVVTGDTGPNAFGRADEALYVAKHRGRNQIQCFEKLIADGTLAQKMEKAQEIELF